MPRSSATSFSWTRTGSMYSDYPIILKSSCQSGQFERREGVFTIADRDRVRDQVLEMASSDRRVVAGAVVGSLALSEGDRWSDLDLTFAVEEVVPLHEVLEDWSRSIVGEFGAAQLFDLPSGPSIYRVFLLPGCLQFDLSFTPASQFGATGPKFKLLFGSAVERAQTPPPDAHELFGYAVHHLLRARFCMERGRLWQAEYWISSARDNALTLACLKRGLLTAHGRGFDALSAAVLAGFEKGLVRSIDREELLRALKHVINALMSEAGEAKDLATRVEPQLRELQRGWES